MSRRDPRDLHAEHELERARTNREKRIRDQAIAEVHEHHRLRSLPLLPYTELRYDPDDEGCVW